QANAIGDRTRLGWAHAYQAHALYISGNSRGAIEAAQQSLVIANALADPALLEWTNFYRAQVAHWDGDYHHAIELLRHNVATLEPELERRGFASRQSVNSRTYLAWCLAELGDFQETGDRGTEADETEADGRHASWLIHSSLAVALGYNCRDAYVV